jgi:hypothetical protein
MNAGRCVGRPIHITTVLDLNVLVLWLAMVTKVVVGFKG